MSKKVLLVATVQSHIAQFHKPLINMLHEAGYEIHVAARNNLSEKNGLSIDEADKVFDVPFARSPYTPKNITAYKELKAIVNQNNYEIVHCNTPVGGILTRLACRKHRKEKKTKVIYQAHGFHFYKGAPLKNWLLYYPLEKIFAKLTDDLITINTEDYEFAKQKMKTNVHIVHGVGADSSRYNTEDVSGLREELGLSEKDFVILCVGELNKNKNQIKILEALSSMDTANIKMLFAGNGPTRDELLQYTNEHGLADVVEFLGYRLDLHRYVKASDLVVSMSIREGLGLNIIEAMMCEKPVVVSDNRGHRELSKDGLGGYMVNSDDNKGLAQKIECMLNDRDSCAQMGTFNLKLSEKYKKESVVLELKNIYGLQRENGKI